MTHQALPSGTTSADRIARSLARLRGPEIQPADGTLVAEDLRTQGQSLADARATILRAVAQAHPGLATTDGLLAELEEEYGLPSGAALPEGDRQQRLLAKYRARGDGSLLAIARTVRTVVPSAALLTLTAESVADTWPEAVFTLVVLVSLATLDDAGQLGELGALLGQQLTTHATWTFGRGAGPDLDPFRCDDVDSACDLDLLAS